MLSRVLTDPRVENWLLMKNPTSILIIHVAYLLVVWLGPKLMASRPPLRLKPVLIPYNFALQALSIYMFYEVRLLRCWGVVRLITYPNDSERSQLNAYRIPAGAAM